LKEENVKIKDMVFNTEQENQAVQYRKPDTPPKDTNVFLTPKPAPLLNVKMQNEKPIKTDRPLEAKKTHLEAA
jgi:hypothetical protein